MQRRMSWWIIDTKIRTKVKRGESILLEKEANGERKERNGVLVKARYHHG